ncbi:MAG: hypothetical protein M3010_03880, partial [Candidatus Dormibacteraeota bacterium]|nr:hypothetical protein [Candidatus Dormibacteraeota bacterium]
DYGLLEAVAAAVPQGTLLLAGRVSIPVGRRYPSGFESLTRRPNVHQTGALDAGRMVGIVDNLDVGLLPYRPTDANRHASPVKLFDYLQAHVPVVSSGVIDLGDAAPWVSEARDVGDFVAAVGHALRSGPIGPGIDSWLQCNTAAARADAALEVLAEAETMR